MDGSKTTYIMPEGGNNDLATTMALMNGNGFNQNAMWNNPWIYFVWMAMMRGGFFGNQNNGNLQADAATQRQIQTVQETLQDNHNSDLIMQGIAGSTDAVRQAADRMGLNYNALQMAVNNVANAVGQVGAQTGFSAERVINAVNAGDSGVSQAICQAACNVRSDITNQGYQNQLTSERQTNTLQNTANANANILNSTLNSNANAIQMQMNNIGNTLQHEFCQQNYNLANQTCEIKNTMKDVTLQSTDAILQKLDSIENQQLLDKIATLQAKNSEQAVIINNNSQNQVFAQMLQQTIAPINANIATLTKDIYEVQSKLPNTVTLPYSNATAVPTSLATYYGSGNNGYWG